MRKFLKSCYFKILLSTIAVIWTLGLKTSNFASVLLVVLFYFFYKNEINCSEKRERIIAGVLSVLLAVFQVAGNYDDFLLLVDVKLVLLIKYILAIAGWCCIFYTLIAIIFKMAEEKDLVCAAQKNSKGIKVFGASFGILILCWLPYFIAYYPGILTWDTEWQFEQALGISSYSNHQPVLHTLFLKLFYNLGIKIFHNPNGGMAVCVFVQMIVMASIFAFLIVILYWRKIRKQYLALCIIFFGIMPFNALYSIAIWKDIFFAGSILLFSIILWELQDSHDDNRLTKIGQIIGFIVVGILVCLLRSNGFYAYLFCIPFMVLMLKKRRAGVILGCIVTLSIVGIVKGPVMEAKHVIQPDIVENLSIPIQHIARVVADGCELTDEEEKLLGQVIEIDRIPEEYLNYISDPIKTLIREKDNQQYIKDNKKEFFFLWLKLGLRYPEEYIKAQIDQTRGYWTTDEQYWVITTEVTEHAEILGMYRDSKLPSGIVRIMEWGENAYMEIPIYGILWSIGFYFWIMLLMLAITIKKKKNILPFLPVLALWGSLMIATPVYAEFRYIYSLIIGIPLFIAISFSSEEERNYVSDAETITNKECL
ncbi:DUF6020 family protein [Bariatricus massiliensis]|nr:DUF6020 family protein [Bariatricus massiliensis]MDY2663173.1 DUF6020 family protein [Bariatricus massiliensis]